MRLLMLPMHLNRCIINGIFMAMDLVEKTGNLPIPPYLKDAHYAGSEKFGNGVGYQYAHDYPNHYVNNK